MNSKFSGVITFGYASLFIMWFIWSLLYTGWISAHMEDALALILTFGFLLALAGIFALFNGEKVDGTLFLIVGGYSFAYMVRILWYPHLEANTKASPFDGWVALIMAFIIFYLWLSSFDSHIFRKLFLIGLWIVSLAVAILNWWPSSVLGVIFGYVSLIVSILAGLYSAYTVLDIGKLRPGKTS